MWWNSPAAMAAAMATAFCNLTETQMDERLKGSTRLARKLGDFAERKMSEEDDDLTIEGLKCFDSDSDAPSDGDAPLSAGSAGSAAPSDEPSDDASDGGGGPRRRHPSHDEIVIDGDGHPELPVREHPRKLTPASHREFAFPVLLHPSRAPSRGHAELPSAAPPADETEAWWRPSRTARAAARRPGGLVRAEQIGDAGDGDDEGTATAWREQRRRRSFAAR